MVLACPISTEEVTGQVPQVRGLSAGIAAVVITVVIANLGNNIISPLMPALKDYFNSSAAEVALVASGFGLGRLAMDIPAGVLTDRIGPTWLFTAGILVSGIAAALAAMSSSLEQLIFFRMVMGFGSSIMSTVALVLLARIAPPGQRGTVLGFYMSAMLLGQAISPTIGGYLGTAFDWRAAFVFCALTPFISFPLNLLVTSKSDAVQSGEITDGGDSIAGGGHSRGNSASLSSVPNWPALATIYFGTFANFFDRHGMRSSLLPLYGGMILGLDSSMIGLILTVGAVITIIVNLPSGTLADRVGKKTLLVPGLLTLIAGNLSLLIGGGIEFFVGATVLTSMGVLSNSMQTALVADLVPKPLVGKGMGIYRFTADLGVVVGPLVTGMIVDRYGFLAALVAGACVVLLGIATTLIFVPRRICPGPLEQTV